MGSDAVMAASEILTAEDFYGNQYGILFQAMVELFTAGKPIDIITLQDKLSQMDVPAELSSIEFIRDLLAAVPTSANVKYYAKIVKEKSTLRKLIKINEDIANTCYVGKEKLDNILDETEKKVFGILQAKDGGDYVPIRQVVINAMEKIEVVSKNKGRVTGIPTGFTDLDYMTSGFHESDLILIAARPARVRRHLN